MADEPKLIEPPPEPPPGEPSNPVPPVYERWQDDPQFANVTTTNSRELGIQMQRGWEENLRQKRARGGRKFEGANLVVDLPDPTPLGTLMFGHPEGMALLHIPRADPQKEGGLWVDENGFLRMSTYVAPPPPPPFWVDRMKSESGVLPSILLAFGSVGDPNTGVRYWANGAPIPNIMNFLQFDPQWGDGEKFDPNLLMFNWGLPSWEGNNSFIVPFPQELWTGFSMVMQITNSGQPMWNDPANDNNVTWACNTYSLPPQTSPGFSFAISANFAGANDPDMETGTQPMLSVSLTNRFGGGASYNDIAYGDGMIIGASFRTDPQQPTLLVNGNGTTPYGMTQQDPVPSWNSMAFFGSEWGSTPSSALAWVGFWPLLSDIDLSGLTYKTPLG